MNPLKHFCCCAAVLALPGTASAAELSVLDVAAAQINCAFEPACSRVNPEIFLDVIALPNIEGIAQMRSQTFPGKPGTPAQGMTGYQYQVDLTRTTAVGDAACVTDMHVHFGPVTKLRYDTAGALTDVYVLSKGGLGTIGLSSAVQSGDVIIFTFEQPVCAGDAPGKGQVSSVFGLTGATAPKAITVSVGMPGTNHINVRAMVPTR